ncbi:MAG: DNA polymerase domain-containing protein [Lentisphaeria bacterium]
MDISQFVSSAICRVVAIEINEQGQCELFRRTQAGEVESECRPFHPWLLTSGVELARCLRNVSDLVELSGAGALRVRVSFPDQASYDVAVKELKRLTGHNPSSPLAPYRIFSDFSQQLLTLLPLRLFREMAFPELRRMQLDIETRSGEPGIFPDANKESDEVILVSLRDSTGWEVCLSSSGQGEAGLLRQMIALVQERDPDVIEGHNIFNFDLPYLEKRCKRYHIGLALGRGKRVVSSRNSRFTAGERMISYQRYSIYGRHVIDTYHLVMLHDVSQRDMDSYGLKAAARYFGINSENRTYVEGADITRIFDEDPERLAAYCLDDVRETDGISRLLSPSPFYQAQVLPLTYQNCVSRGTATRIDALLCAEYLQRSYSLPTPQMAQSFQGGLTESVEPGVFTNVWHIDVRSLYPSVILAKNLHPVHDELGVFSKLLEQLRTFRLSAKDAMRTAEPELRDHYQALQSSFKILINSFYGYLGFSQGTFNDYNMAREVTAEGRAILTKMNEYLLSQGAKVIEMDTDGIYFSPPQDVQDMAEMQGRVQSILPPGIDVELDASYQAMYAYKSKNYALLELDGKVSITGAALKSRGLELFQRKYIKEHVTLLLMGRADELPALYERYETAIREHRFPLKELAKREVLSTAPETYAQKLAEGSTKRSAAYELVLKSKRNYRQGDRVEFYITGNKKSVSITDNSKLLEEGREDQRDENVELYLNRLRQLRDKFL